MPFSMPDEIFRFYKDSLIFLPLFSSYRTISLNSAAFYLIIYSLQMRERWNLSLLERMTRLLDDGKRAEKKRKGRGFRHHRGRCSGNTAVFLKKLVKEQGNL